MPIFDDKSELLEDSEPFQLHVHWQDSNREVLDIPDALSWATDDDVLDIETETKRYLIPYVAIAYVEMDAPEEEDDEENSNE